MCLVIAVILAIFAFNAMMAGSIGVGSMAIAGSVFFIFLMVRNIRHVRRLRDEKKKTEMEGEDK